MYILIGQYAFKTSTAGTVTYRQFSISTSAATIDGTRLKQNGISTAFPVNAFEVDSIPTIVTITTNTTFYLNGYLIFASGAFITLAANTTFSAVRIA